MDSRKSMRQVAEAILLTYEMNVGASPPPHEHAGIRP